MQNDSSPDENAISIDISDYPTVQELIKRYAKAVLARYGNRKERASKHLGINRRTLYRWEQEWAEEEGKKCSNTN